MKDLIDPGIYGPYGYPLKINSEFTPENRSHSIHVRYIFLHCPRLIYHQNQPVMDRQLCNRSTDGMGGIGGFQASFEVTARGVTMLSERANHAMKSRMVMPQKTPLSLMTFSSHTSRDRTGLRQNVKSFFRSLLDFDVMLDWEPSSVHNSRKRVTQDLILNAIPSAAAWWAKRDVLTLQ